MSGVVVIDGNAGSLTGAALRGGDLVVKGRVGARTGIDQKGGTIIVLGDAGSMNGVHDAARPPDHLRRRRARARRLDVRRHDLRRRQGALARHRLRARRVDGRRHRVHRAQVPHLRPRRRRPSSRSSSAARSSTTTTTSSPPSASWFFESWPTRPHLPSRPSSGTARSSRPEVIERHPHEGRARPLPHARLLDVQADPALGRADVHAGHADPLRDRGLPREVRDEDGPRRALRQEADRARHPRLHHRHELRRAVARGEDGAREGRIDGGHGDVLGRGRDDPAGARPTRPSGTTSASRAGTGSTRTT